MTVGPPGTAPSERSAATSDGLSSDGAARRLAADGPNELPERRPPSVVRRVVGHVVEPLSVVLLAAAVLSGAFLGHVGEAAAIGAIVVLNAGIATVQEQRAASALAALRALAAPQARVRRDGAVIMVAAAGVVVGDRLELDAGDRVAADAVVVTSASLEVDEAMLSGESLPVGKAPGDPLLAGTLAVRGSGAAEVVATGAGTTMAGLATAMSTTVDPPLVRDLHRVAVWMSSLAIGLGAALVPIVFARSQGEDEPLVTALLTGVALAVAALPEGLATVVVGALAVGARRLAQDGAVVRELAAVEALGVVDVLCTDKTGTLTTGGLEVGALVPATGRSEEELWTCLRRCSDSRGGTGDPLDVAIDAALPPAIGSTPAEPRLATAPFDAATRSMATVVDVGGSPVLSVKGAPEAVLPRCRPGDAADRLRATAEALASEGMRVLAVASATSTDLEATDLDACGVVAFHDPLRPSAAEAVDRCRRAGIRLVMVTGDHPSTARAIAGSVGIDGTAVTGAELAGLPPALRDARLVDAGVVARVDPFTKVALVDAHRAAGRVVAMTGDGVNDAPALRHADIGVAIAGDAGTDVAREAAQLVVTNGDLGTIVTAIAEGRRIRSNLRAVVAYLLAGNLSEVLVVAAGLVLFPELAVPLLPVQLLWCNLVTDGVPALALGVDRTAIDPLAGRPAARSLLDRPLLRRLVVRGAIMAGAVLGTAAAGRAAGWDEEVVRSQLLLSLVVVHLLSAYAARARRHAFEAGWWRNRVLGAAIGGSLLLQVVAFGTPAGRAMLGLAATSPAAWGLALLAGGVALAGLAATELGRSGPSSPQVLTVGPGSDHPGSSS